MFLNIICCLIAGAIAGIGTVFVGLSAATAVGPILITFLDVPAYQAVGIGLASDVLASLISAYTYKKNDNLDVKNPLPLLISVLIMTIVGSYVASLLPEKTMGNAMQIALIFLGLRFIFKPVVNTRESMESEDKKQRLIKAIAGGVMVGFICGFIGAGGGIMLLFVLTSFLGYEMHMAVGTSVFIMAFTALTGSVSHFAISGVNDISVLVMCIVFTLIFARIALVIANRTDSRTLNKFTGVTLIVTSAVLLIINLFK